MHTIEQLYGLLAELTGKGDQSLAIDTGYKRARVFVAQDESHLDPNDRGFTVATGISGLRDWDGKELRVSAQGKTQEEALTNLCGVIVETREKHYKRYVEEATKARKQYNDFFYRPTIPAGICGADASIPFEPTTIGEKCQNSLPCPKHGNGGPYR